MFGNLFIFGGIYNKYSIFSINFLAKLYVLTNLGETYSVLQVQSHETRHCNWDAKCKFCDSISYAKDDCISEESVEYPNGQILGESQHSWDCRMYL